MALPLGSDIVQLGPNNTGGCRAPGLHNEAPVAVGSATTATASDSGTTYLLDTAAGSILTLPAPVAGMKFQVYVSTSVTSNSHKINTDAATTFIGGAIQMGIDASATSELQVGDPTSHVTITMNGSTTGGLLGTYIVFEAISSTVWLASGLVVGSGVLATPYA